MNLRILGFAFLMVSAPLLVNVALADEFDTFNIVAGLNVQRDNNVFRLDDNVSASAAGVSSRDDVLKTGFIGLRVNKPYGLQRFKFDITETAYRYQQNDFLNYSATDYKAAWLWALTPHLTGNLSVSRNKSLVDFRDFIGVGRLLNIRTAENQRFDADWSPYNNWHLLAGVSRDDLNNSQTFNQDASYSQIGADLGVKYVFPSNSSISFLTHSRKGNFEGRRLNALALLDTGFDERESELKLDWVISGKSRLNARLAYLSRDHNNFSRRDYSDYVGNITYSWIPTGKLKFDLTASKGLGSFQTNTDSFFVSEDVNLSSSWFITNKTMLKAMAGFGTRDFRGDGPLVGVFDRKDDTKNASLELSWSPLRSVTVSGSLQRSRRDSTQTGLDFTDTTAGISTQLFF